MPEISNRSYRDRPACSGGSGGTCIHAKCWVDVWHSLLYGEHYNKLRILLGGRVRVFLVSIIGVRSY